MTCSKHGDVAVGELLLQLGSQCATNAAGPSQREAPKNLTALALHIEYSVQRVVHKLFTKFIKLTEVKQVLRLAQPVWSFSKSVSSARQLSVLVRAKLDMSFVTYYCKLYVVISREKTQLVLLLFYVPVNIPKNTAR